ncbi:MAG: hypothetical protein DWQ36_01055 [Acidobacteria bacterium]|nr:MAG: hypothetical protein DWQ30_15145 [Acidobacteriota bacterium]REK11762.1 MAG: hypothetical protein DWQ36_01055 [Acidobacteriota bacterium]
MRKRRLSNQLSNRKSVVTGPRHVTKVGRNDPCPCGSGRKYKDCHIKEGEAFLQGLRDAERKRALIEQGVPWYKRWFL